MVGLEVDNAPLAAGVDAFTSVDEIEPVLAELAELAELGEVLEDDPGVFDVAAEAWVGDAGSEV